MESQSLMFVISFCGTSNQQLDTKLWTNYLLEQVSSNELVSFQFHCSKQAMFVLC